MNSSITKYFSITDNENTITHYVHLNNNNELKKTDLEDNDETINDATNLFYVYKNQIYFFDRTNVIITKYNESENNEELNLNEDIKDFVVLSNKIYSIVYITNEYEIKFSSNKIIEEENLYFEEDTELSFLKLSDNDNICFLQTDSNQNKKIIEIEKLGEERFIHYIIPDNFQGNIINYEICDNIAYILSDENKLYYKDQIINNVQNIALFDYNIYYLTNIKIDGEFKVINLTKNELEVELEQQITNLFSTDNDLIVVDDENHVIQISIPKEDEEVRNIPKTKETNKNNVNKYKNKISITFYIFLGLTLFILVSLTIRYIINHKKIKKKK